MHPNSGIGFSSNAQQSTFLGTANVCESAKAQGIKLRNAVCQPTVTKATQTQTPKQLPAGTSFTVPTPEICAGHARWWWVPTKMGEMWHIGSVNFAKQSKTHRAKRKPLTPGHQESQLAQLTSEKRWFSLPCLDTYPAVLQDKKSAHSAALLNHCLPCKE